MSRSSFRLFHCAAALGIGLGALLSQACGGASCPEGSSEEGGRCVSPQAGDDGIPPGVPLARVPWNGYFTGSVHAAATTARRLPLRPSFRWDAVENAQRYQIQIDDSCEIADFRACAFPSPEVDQSPTETSFTPEADLPVSTSAPVGRRYYWRVRACKGESTCSEWSAVRYLEVGRLVADVTGDGYGDILAGAYLPTRQGALSAFTGRPNWTFQVNATAIALTGGQARNDFEAFTREIDYLGDVNGDGYSDYAVSAYGRNGPNAATQGAAGAVVVFLSEVRPTSVARNQVVLRAPSPEFGAYFGFSLAGAGDVNGDGYADMVVGAHGSDLQPGPGTPLRRDAGAAFLYYGGPQGFSAMPSLTIQSPDPQASAFLGHAVTGVDDVNGDGYSDVVVTASQQNLGKANQGAAFLYLGGEGGLNPTPVLTLSDPEGAANHRFGFSATRIGDADGDGLADFAIGTERGRGGTHVFYGDAAGMPTRRSVLNRGTSTIDSGHVLAGAGDLNGDGYDDLAIGAPFDVFHPPMLNGTSSGVAWAFLSSDRGFANDSRLPATPVYNSGTTFVGAAVTGLDFDGDGYQDLFVGGSGTTALGASGFEEGGAGSVSAWSGNKNLSFSIQNKRMSVFSPAPFADELFAWSLGVP